MNIFCIEQNYFAHKQQRLQGIPSEPVIFVKPPSALSEPGSSFPYPVFADELYCGCELVLRISQCGIGIVKEMAGNYYDAISVGVNFTALDNQYELNEDQSSWEKAKAWDNSSVVGNWMPATDFRDKNDINFCLYINRELVQLGHSELLINNFDTIISSLSKTFPLNIGDLIFTGTPVGMGKLVAGDKLEAFIEDDSLLEFDVEPATPEPTKGDLVP